MEIKYYNRSSNCYEIEKVYGDKLIEWLYASRSGAFFERILSKRFFSKIVGAVQNRVKSRNKIEKFIKDYEVKMGEFEYGYDLSNYLSFNDFFIRKFKDGIRNFVSEKNIMPAFTEARYFGYESIHAEIKIPVKEEFLSAKSLIGKKWSDTFEDGPVLIARLCPVDYHRFHFPDDGSLLDSFRVEGAFHSVSPIALNSKKDIFATNERHVSILETENFGKLAYVEVGAMCVGKIVQSYNNDNFSRGDEKGYFLFGGSTVIVIGEKGKWIPTKDIINHTNSGVEVLANLGTPIAKSSSVLN